MTPEQKSTLRNYLMGRQPFDFSGTQRHSSLITGLRVCREATKRNIETGIYSPEITSGYEGNWLGSIGYFTVLDQIGSCFKLKDIDGRAKNENSITYSIRTFGYDIINRDNRQLHALKSLRNAFTHDFNLLNIPDKATKFFLERHKFTVTVDTDTPIWIVKLPEEDNLWDGNVEFKDFSKVTDVTFVNLFGIAEMTEKIYIRICEFFEQDQLQINCSVKELINKYSFVTY